MKKLIPMLFILILAMVFTACGTSKMNIEEYEWQLQSVTKLNENSDNTSANDVILTVKDGEIIIKDMTDEEVYKGAYEEMLVTDTKDDYKVLVEGKEGYMSLSENEAGETVLLLTVDNYDLSFFIK